MGNAFSSYLVCPLDGRALDIDRSRLVTSENEGRAPGSVDQHCSINFLHSGSQRSGTGGLRVSFRIPPAFVQLGAHQETF